MKNKRKFDWKKFSGLVQEIKDDTMRQKLLQYCKNECISTTHECSVGRSTQPRYNKSDATAAASWIARALKEEIIEVVRPDFCGDKAVVGQLSNFQLTSMEDGSPELTKVCCKPHDTLDWQVSYKLTPGELKFAASVDLGRIEMLINVDENSRRQSCFEIFGTTFRHKKLAWCCQKSLVTKQIMDVFCENIRSKTQCSAVNIGSRIHIIATTAAEG